MQDHLLFIKQNKYQAIILNFVIVIISYHLLSKYHDWEPSIVYVTNIILCNIYMSP